MALIKRRFTPTGVGKTRRAPSARRPPAVHPHRCGENALVNRHGEIPRGSPPQVWGKHPAPEPTTAPPRFTPTGVGKTSNTASQSQ